MRGVGDWLVWWLIRLLFGVLRMSGYAESAGLLRVSVGSGAIWYVAYVVGCASGSGQLLGAQLHGGSVCHGMRDSSDCCVQVSGRALSGALRMS